MKSIKLGLLSITALLISCAGPDPTVECRKWVREGCTYLVKCGLEQDVDGCVMKYDGSPNEDERTCPASLQDPYCADLGDDFARCADEVKQASCNSPRDATICTLYTSSRSQCPILGRMEIRYQ